MKEVKEDYTESNRLIAKFMNVPTRRAAGDEVLYDIQSSGLPLAVSIPVGKPEMGVATPLWIYRAEQLVFHSSWDWLMPVIQKIRNMYYNVTLSGCSTIDRNAIMKRELIKKTGIKWDDILPIAEEVNGMAIESVYSLVATFVTWYNQQTKSQQPCAPQNT